MATGKKSFVLYCDMKHMVELLDDASAGKLLKHLLRYVNDENPETDDAIIKIAFEPIKQQLKRDLKDWESTREVRVNAGHLGGIKSGESRRKKQTNQMLQKESKPKQNKANEAVNVNGSVTVNVNDTYLSKNEIFKPNYDFVLELSEMDVGRAIEYISTTKHVPADKELVLALFGAFKTKNFTGENPYKSNKHIVSHFFQSLKYEQINGKSKKDRVVGRDAVHDKL